MRYCGREFTDGDIQLLQRIMKDNAGINRYQLSIKFCEEAGWRKADGGLKDMSCRVALLRMQRDGHISLPAPQKPHNKPGAKRTLFALPQPEVNNKAGEHVLQIAGTHDRPSPSTHVGVLVHCPDCQIAFDLVPDQRVNGSCGEVRCAPPTSARSRRMWRKLHFASARQKANGACSRPCGHSFS